MNRGDHLATIAEVLAGTTGAKVPYPIGIRELEVVRSEMVGTGLLRLTLGGPELAGFESHAPDEHVRLVYPDADGTLRLPERDGFSLKWPRPLPISREYTVRRYDAEAGELDLDFALHDGGYASDWAQAATVGTRVHVAGPPGGVVVPWTYDRYLLAGDITALPAIARWLEMMPAAAAGGCSSRSPTLHRKSNSLFRKASRCDGCTAVTSQPVTRICSSRQYGRSPCPKVSASTPGSPVRPPVSSPFADSCATNSA